MPYAHGGEERRKRVLVALDGSAWANRRGRPAEEILASTRESGANLIAMATHACTGLGRLRFGSVAEAVLRDAPVPVFMISEPHPIAGAPAARRKEAVR
jgi:nucleotide-binding universal stress UspA family protein